MEPQVVSSGIADMTSPGDVRTFRQAATQNGYPLIRVRSRSKKPLPHDWQRGDSEEALFNVHPDAMNTGLVLTGLRCVDIDVDDPEIVRRIIQKAQQHLPSGGMIRFRTDSPRLALLYQAADGEPGKRSAVGLHGKVEILGRGQQVVCHGLHPSGTAYAWMRGRGPDTKRRDQLPAVSEDQIGRFLGECSPLLGAASDHGALIVSAAERMLVTNDALAAGIEVYPWFATLPPNDQSAVVRACLSVLDNRKNDPREAWLPIVFAGAHAEQLGCPDAYQQVLVWSRQGASWTSERDFETAWTSAKPGTPGGIGIGTLLARARKAGLDLSPWRDKAFSKSHETVGKAPLTPSADPAAQCGALCAADLPPVPAKRQWLHDTSLARGAVSLLVAPGGRGKSSFVVVLGLACASARPLLGGHVFGGPLRVLLVNAEDSTSEIALRVRAAMKHHGLCDDDVRELHVAGADRLSIPLLRASGSAPILDQAGWALLMAELDRLKPDVLILDPLVSLMGGVSSNDNAAAALLMSRLVTLAAERRIGIMIVHHAAKGRDPASAESAMGAVSFVNLSRIALGIEPLAESDAGKLGLPPWEARSVFRLVGTKQNLSAPDETDRWFRLTSVQMENAEPPVYPNGDRVGVIEVFRPSASGPAFPPGLIRGALRAIRDADPPLSPSKRATGRWAGSIIAAAIAPHREGRASDVEAVAVLDHLKRTGLIAVEPVKLHRSGSRSDTRDGLVLTAAGKSVLQVEDEAPP